MKREEKKETLIIVESPTKAKTIGRFLGEGFNIQSSFGHIRDLPRSKLGIDTDHQFEPQYIVPMRARKNVTALRKLATGASRIVLATDEDREGEAIAWHLTTVLDPSFTISTTQKKLEGTLPPVERIAFHEITETAIREALERPRPLNQNLVNAQQARRVLDRLVGYLLSPFLWKKVVRGLSAGRVQSVALRLIVEREGEIGAFKPDEYWSIAALLKKHGDGTGIEALLHAKNDESIPKLGIADKKAADAIVNDLQNASYAVSAVERREMRRNPLPPFTTSTMQQEANRRLRMSARRTMMLAQHLYEKGFITYMRTDSVNLSRESLAAARQFIEQAYGKPYLIPAPRVFTTKSRLAQEAHEAIRPTNPLAVPDELPGDDPGERKLYDLIWRRFVASQLPQAVVATTKIDVEARSADGTKNRYTLSANGSTLTFDGFLKVWPTKFEERRLPPLEKGDTLDLEALKPEQHFTEPPPRYNEASLIKSLEAYGIGRPSPYAPTISVI
ncbi:MAG: type I DNA topoisomerase, partial [Patescibacteria group bacterium]